MTVHSSKVGDTVLDGNTRFLRMSMIIMAFTFWFYHCAKCLICRYNKHPIRTKRPNSAREGRH